MRARVFTTEGRQVEQVTLTVELMFRAHAKAVSVRKRTN
jgi:hypothetical protein